MGGAKKSTWVGGTVFIALVIVAAAWFLAINPAMAAAADLRSQAESTRQQNDLFEQKVAKLKADFEKLPQYKADLAAIQLQIPSDAMLADYLRQLDQIAVAHSVTLTIVAPSVPQAVVLAVPAAPAPAPTEESGKSGDSNEAPAEPAPAAGANGPNGFTAIPISITALGTYDNTLAFLSDLQNGTSRLLLVTGFVGTSQKQQDASGGKPATQPGDQELVITGYTYALPDALAVPAAVDPEAAPPVLPGVVPGKNPLVPISGH